MGVLDTNFLLVLPRAVANIGERWRERQGSSYLTCLLQYLHGNTRVWMPNKPFSEISLIPLSFLVPSAFRETMIISWNIWRITLNHRKPMQKKFKNKLSLPKIHFYLGKRTKQNNCQILHALYTKMVSPLPSSPHTPFKYNHARQTFDSNTQVGQVSLWL